MTIKGKNEICSDDEVICLKDVNIAMDSCEKVTLDFKVQYANQWSKNQHIVVHSDLDDVGYLSPQYFFIPSFES
ncbi:hypothetical protein A0J61_02772 [Choanephora cucurbitarum]|uniref:Uncharacterized protein n=1 Tax=Choanephora cucurbitarum TaxID=101091 RepID=A0A1C7NPM2_9FUNG|nr:hypothetical protein A0J61_02772 [Choanephora cucurbitarum]